MAIVPRRGQLTDMFGNFAQRPTNPWELPPEQRGLQGAAPGTSAPGAVDPQQQQSDQMFQKIMQLTSGRADEIRNDPVQAQVMDYLKGVLGGKNVPYSDTVLNSLQAQHGRGSAAAEAAQMQTLRDSLGASGGSIYDPSYQAASREAMSQRQGQNLDYAGQLNAQAGVANFDARQNASGLLGQLRGQQNAQISGLTQSAAGFQAGRFLETPSTTPQTLMPQYGGGGQMGQAGGQAGGQPKATPSAQSSGFEPYQQGTPSIVYGKNVPTQGQQQPAQPQPQQTQPQQSPWQMLSAPAVQPFGARKAYDPNMILGLTQPKGY